jgi:hypothetical protein
MFQRPRSRSLTALVVLVLGFGTVRYVAAWAGSLSENFDGLDAGEVWKVSTTHGAWRSVLDGNGRTSIRRDGSLTLALHPARSVGAAQTHSALVISRAEFGDVDVRLRMKTLRQLRIPAPNSWEVGRVVWRYVDGDHFNYFIAKPGGWEIGRRDPAWRAGERLLASGIWPRFSVGLWHEVRIRHAGQTISATADGVRLPEVIDAGISGAKGAVGMYCEDAECRFDDIAISS